MSKNILRHNPEDSVKTQDEFSKLTPKDREMLARAHLYDERERKIVEAICRKTGQTNFNVEQLGETFAQRGNFRKYADGTSVFSFDGEDLLLFGPVEITSDHRAVQWMEYLYDKRDFKVEEDIERAPGEK